MSEESETLPPIEARPTGLSGSTGSAFRIFNEDGTLDHEMLNIAARAGHKERDEQDMEKALELTSAGWQAEIQDHHTPHPFTGNVDVMSWYWRRPPRRKGSKGRLYLSTNQAWNAMKRDSQNT